MRAGAALLAVLLVVSGCGDGRAATTLDPRRGPAVEYSVSAQRALDGTRFDDLGDDVVAGLVLQVCDAMQGSADPNATVMGVLEGIEAPEGLPVDDEIMAVVLAEGASTICPAEIREAELRAWEAADPEDRYLAAVAAVAPVTEEGFTDDDLLVAGRGVCAALDGGGTPEQAVLEELDQMFGITGVSIDEIAGGAAGEKEGLLAGGVLGAAASILCPQHREAVTAFLEALAEQNS